MLRTEGEQYSNSALSPFDKGGFRGISPSFSQYSAPSPQSSPFVGEGPLSTQSLARRPVRRSFSEGGSLGEGGSALSTVFSPVSPFSKGGFRGICFNSSLCIQHSALPLRKSPSVPLFQRGKRTQSPASDYACPDPTTHVSL